MVDQLYRTFGQRDVVFSSIHHLTRVRSDWTSRPDPTRTLFRKSVHREGTQHIDLRRHPRTAMRFENETFTQGHDCQASAHHYQWTFARAPVVHQMTRMLETAGPEINVLAYPNNTLKGLGLDAR